MEGSASTIIKFQIVEGCFTLVNGYARNYIALAQKLGRK